MFLSFVVFAVVSIIWFVYGYQLTFGTDIWGFIGTVSNPLFGGIVESNSLSTYAPTIPTGLYAVFQ